MQNNDKYDPFSPVNGAINEGKGRVDEDIVEELRGKAVEYWQEEINDLSDAYTVHKPDPAEDNYVKKMNELARFKNQQWRNLKEMARVMAGVIHPKGRNTEEERMLAKDIIDAARDDLAARGVDVRLHGYDEALANRYSKGNETGQVNFNEIRERNAAATKAEQDEIKETARKAKQSKPRKSK